jgi:hypothetical protein
MKATRVLHLAAISILCAACETTGYGAHQFQVTLNTVPANCRAWVVRDSNWVLEQELLQAGDEEALEKYELHTTPFTITLPPYPYVFLAKNAEQRVLWKPFKPSQDSTVTLDFGPAVTPR